MATLLSTRLAEGRHHGGGGRRRSQQSAESQEALLGQGAGGRRGSITRGAARRLSRVSMDSKMSFESLPPPGYDDGAGVQALQPPMRDGLRRLSLVLDEDASPDNRPRRQPSGPSPGDRRGLPPPLRNRVDSYSYSDYSSSGSSYYSARSSMCSSTFNKSFSNHSFSQTNRMFEEREIVDRGLERGLGSFRAHSSQHNLEQRLSGGLSSVGSHRSASSGSAPSTRALLHHGGDLSVETQHRAMATPLRIPRVAADVLASFKRKHQSFRRKSQTFAFPIPLEADVGLYEPDDPELIEATAAAAAGNHVGGNPRMAWLQRRRSLIETTITVDPPEDTAEPPGLMSNPSETDPEMQPALVRRDPTRLVLGMGLGRSVSAPRRLSGGDGSEGGSEASSAPSRQADARSLLHPSAVTGSGTSFGFGGSFGGSFGRNSSAGSGKKKKKKKCKGAGKKGAGREDPLASGDMVFSQLGLALSPSRLSTRPNHRPPPLRAPVVPEVAGYEIGPNGLWRRPSSENAPKTPSPEPTIARAWPSPGHMENVGPTPMEWHGPNIPSPEPPDRQGPMLLGVESGSPTARRGSEDPSPRGALKFPAMWRTELSIRPDQMVRRRKSSVKGDTPSPEQ